MCYELSGKGSNASVYCIDNMNMGNNDSLNMNTVRSVSSKGSWN